MADEHLIESHREWLGYVQPVGLLVAAPALVSRGIHPDKNVAPLQARLAEVVAMDPDDRPNVANFPAFAQGFLGWQSGDLAGAEGGPPLPATLGANLIEYGEWLQPTYAVPEAGSGATGWQMLVRVEAAGIDLDRDIEDDGRRWAASPHARFERLLRDTGVPVGLLFNGHAFRLVYAPKGETSGFATFNLNAMLEVSGRPMLSAFQMLLEGGRFFGAPEQNLGALLAESRQYQETVSTQLAEQVLAAMHELLRGLAAADARHRPARTTIVDLARHHPDELYGGLLTALMRLVFILFAEDRDLFPRTPLWEQNYALNGLFERLRADAALNPETMDDRFGAWAQLVGLWRIIHGGARHGSLKLIARRGRLFDPDRFPFLEGRPQPGDPLDMPPVSDGVVWRMLKALMMLDGERLSYRTLDVEQIGSVYQAIMGFTIELSEGRSVAIKSGKGGAAATINLEALLSHAPAKRAEWLRERTDRKLTPKAGAAVKGAKDLADLEEALSGAIDHATTPRPIEAGVPVLQPTEERRRTGSHYTPRVLTRPIVEEALRPILDRLGLDAKATDILELKVLDPAVGSGAFLVEACRQLGERIVQAWERHKDMPALPADEDASLLARRLVAQRCLYGVDRNAMAIDLARLSLWLATLARDHEFTFLDHAIRHGDALVGLFRENIAQLHWERADSDPFAAQLVRDRIALAQAERQRIRTAVEDASEHELRSLLDRADRALADVTLVGDAVVAAFFEADKPKDRDAQRQKIVAALGFGGVGWQDSLRPMAANLRAADRPLYPFHWELQFPEVFLRTDPGFDCVVGNPPYAGKNGIIAGNPDHYLVWLQTIHEGAHGNADLSAHFFRRAFRLLRTGGTFGLIATNTIRQGDTRGTGLRWLRENGGIIYAARRRYKWPGEAAVVVSVLHVAKGGYQGGCSLDGKSVEKITAYLVERGTDDDPKTLVANAGKSFQGTIVLGMGFTFDDTDTKGKASSLSEMRRLIKSTPKNAEVIFPYIGYSEVASSPTHAHHRYVIDFGDMALEEAMQWPELVQILKEKVQPEREKQKRKPLRERWWQYAEKRPGLYSTIHGLERVLVAGSQASSQYAFAFLPRGLVYSSNLSVVAVASYAGFAALQSRVHEIWARFFMSTMKDDLAYTPTTCFEPFPFPACWQTLPELEVAGAAYYDFRRELMVQDNQGLTEIYNRFHDPNDRTASIEKMRDLHTRMDCAMLDAYGWTDLQPEPHFEREWEDDIEASPWRYRWPEEVRDLVLARLLALNEEQAREEARMGVIRPRKSRKSAEDQQEFKLE
jgi:hypothetical protein